VIESIEEMLRAFPHHASSRNPNAQVLAPFGEDTTAISDPSGKADWEAKLMGPLSCMAVAGTTLAAGGKERELGLWDVVTGQSVWEARNVPHDKLDLRQPVWVTAASFLDGDGAQRTVAIGTAYKQVGSVGSKCYVHYR
jgi:hypothetical protein